MLEHRYDAIVPGEYEGIVGGHIGLLRLVLTNDGPLTDPDSGRQHMQPDVFCYLNAHQARQLADQLCALADQLAVTTPPTA